MKYQISSINFLILLASIVSQGYLGWAIPAKSNTALDFDMLILTQSWLPTFCQTQEKFRLQHFCSIIHDYERWSIHGLWPYKRSTGGPENCDDSKPLNMKEIEDYIPQLQNKWVDVKAVNNINNREDIGQSFWANEWQKHGTCAVDITKKNVQKEYFAKSLMLFDRYNMKNLLEQANIKPGSQNSYYDLSSKINDIVGKECQLSCRTDNTINIQWLAEIRVCFNKNLDPINCGKSRTTLSLCHQLMLITYPDSSSSNPQQSIPTGTGPRGAPTGAGPRGAPTGAGPRGSTSGAGSWGAPSRADQSTNWRDSTHGAGSRGAPSRADQSTNWRERS